MKVVFVSGPFSGANAWEVEQNVRRCEALVLRVAELGAAPLCLNLMGRFFNGTLEYDAWIHVAFEQIRRSDAILFAHGWEGSNGCGRELKLAQELDKPVFDERDTLVPLQNWLEGSP